MAASSPLWVWMDLEMTGLLPEQDVIIEMATIITDIDLNIVAEGPSLIIQREATRFATMDEWNRTTHTKSGLWQMVIDSTISEADAEAQTLAFIRQHVKPNESPLCGNSIWQDRRFLARYMKTLDSYLHYRMIDVSTLKELTKRWFPAGPKAPEKTDAHRALDDIRASIEELRFYREHFLSAST